MILAAFFRRWSTTSLTAVAMLLVAAGPVRAATAPDASGPAPDSATDAEPSESSGEPPFDVWEYRVQGNTLLPGLTLEKVVYPLLGPGKRVADVEQARAAVEQAYRDAGYPTVFVDIPEQQVTGGLVRLNVTEGQVASVRVTGARYFRSGWIRDQVPEAATGVVPRIGVFQQQLRSVATRSADRSITPVLRPGRAPGTVDIELKVQDRLPVNGSLEVNNRAVPNTTPTRVSASVRYDNLWQRDHSLGFQYQVAPEDTDETEVFALSYVLRPKASNVSYAFYAVKSDSDIAVPIGGIDVFGEGVIIGGRAVLPLPGSDSFINALQLGVDYKDFDEVIDLNVEGQPDRITPVSYLNWSVTWNGTRVRETNTQGFELGLNLGLRGAGNSTPEFEGRRLKARANYLYLTAGYDLLRTLPWSSSLYLSANGQIAPQALVPNEQFNAGGLDTVRGYFESEALGDLGFQGQLEWRGPNFGPGLLRWLDSAYGYSFVDWASLVIRSPSTDQDDAFTLYSAGLGLRLKAEQFSAAVDWAWPFRSGTATESGDDRLLFLMRMDF